MAMKYVFGFDGGGTKTDCALYTLDGHLVSWRRYSGTNHENMPGGFSELEPILLSMIHETLADASISPSDVAGAVFGAAGVDVLSQKRSFEALLNKSGLRNSLVVNDAFLGIKAGTPFGIGCCLVNGTGNTVGGIDAAGTRIQVGGSGPMLGEVGGSWLIARSVIRAAYDELFRLGPDTALTNGVLHLIGSTGVCDFVERVYENYLGSDRREDKQFVQLLFTSARNGDAVASELLQRLGRDFAHSLAGCIRLLNFGHQVDIVLVGSVTLKATCSLMMDALQDTLPRLTGKKHTFYPLTVPPAVGAVFWAMESAGFPPDTEVKERMMTSASKMTSP